MYEGKLVFSQVMDHAPQHLFRRCVRQYSGNRYVKTFPCWSQFLCMAFAQLSYRASLRDIEVSLRAHARKLHHMGIRGGVSRNTLANANRRRDWRIYAAFAQELIAIARPLHAGEPLGPELDNTVYALDSSIVDLCLSVFPWALFRSTKSAIKLHTLLDLRGNIPAFIHVSHAKLGDVNALDLLIPEPGAFYIMDRIYLGRLNVLHSMGAFFVIRAKSNTRYRRRYSHPVDKSTGVQCDQTIVLTGVTSRKDYPQPLRRVKYRDAITGKTFNFLTNGFAVPASTIAQLYHCRWQVELFFWAKARGMSAKCCSYRSESGKAAMRQRSRRSSFGGETSCDRPGTTDRLAEGCKIFSNSRESSHARWAGQSGKNPRGDSRSQSGFGRVHCPSRKGS